MEHIIKAAVERGASDLHIKAGDVFRARIDGEFKPLTKQRLTPEQTKAIALQMISSEADREMIDSIRDYDCSWGAPGIGRFRVNILRQRSSFMVVMRAIPFDIPSIDKLQLPKAVAKITEIDHGLVFVAGPAGSGKSSTVAALIHHMNSSMSKHIVTLEDPIEFLHRDIQCSVTQREVGVDTESFSVGIRASLRQDPDVVFLSDLHDHEVANTAMQAAERGALVICIVHTPDATSTIARMVTMFPSEDQEVARIRLADAMQAVIAQRLLPRADGAGRVAAVELLRSTPEIREVIRNRHRAGELRDALEASSVEYETQSFDQHIVQLAQTGVITQETAVAAASDPSVLNSDAGSGKQPRRGSSKKSE